MNNAKNAINVFIHDIIDENEYTIILTMTCPIKFKNKFNKYYKLVKDYYKNYFGKYGNERFTWGYGTDKYDCYFDACFTIPLTMMNSKKFVLWNKIKDRTKRITTILLSSYPLIGINEESSAFLRKKD